ncbi:hypothetical protein KIPB_014613, partial [Kipferlia bialata]|eukprot:g14613.t1
MSTPIQILRRRAVSSVGRA